MKHPGGQANERLTGVQRLGIGAVILATIMVMLLGFAALLVIPAGA